jgi:hypothetical protein
MTSVRLVVTLLTVLAAGSVLERLGTARGADCLTSYDVDGSPESLAVGDFNGDGRLDVVAANRFGPHTLGHQVWVLLEAGGGAFGAATAYDAGDGPASVAAGDLNGDGHLDLAVVNSAGSHGPTPTLETVSVLLGTGSGGFGAPVPYSVGVNTYPDAVALGDFNGDRRLDLVVTLFSNQAAVLLGRGDGSFDAATTYVFAGSGVASVLVGDVNGDRHLDLIAPDDGDNAVSVLLGSGNGDFAGSIVLPTGTDPVSVALSDFNEDGHADLVVANSADNTASVLLGAGDGQFNSASAYAVRTKPASVAVGDFDGDAHVDVAVANSVDDTLSVLLGDGNGRFGAEHAYAVGGAPVDIVAADFDSDGRSDLAVANLRDKTVSALLAVTTCVDATPRLCVGDCNNDSAVTIAELLALVNIALDSQTLTACPVVALWVDRSAYPEISVSRLVKAVNNALYGCAFCAPGTCRVSRDETCAIPTGPVGNACCQCGYDGWCAIVCICASPDTPIATPTGERPISSLNVGDLVYSTTAFGIVAVPVLQATRQAVRSHHVIRVELASGVVLEISGGHPTADGRTFGELRVGDTLGDTEIVSVHVVPYAHDHTYDILPASESGVYFAGGVPIGSTLRRH